MYIWPTWGLFFKTLTHNSKIATEKIKLCPWEENLGKDNV